MSLMQTSAGEPQEDDLDDDAELRNYLEDMDRALAVHEAGHGDGPCG